jgi:hypothetical protein
MLIPKNMSLAPSSPSAAVIVETGAAVVYSPAPLKVNENELRIESISACSRVDG